MDSYNAILQFLLHGLPHQPIPPKCQVIRLLFIVMHQGIQSLLFHGASVILIIPTVDSQIFKKHGKNIGENIDSFANKAFCSETLLTHNVLIPFHLPFNFRIYENGSLLIDKSNAEDEGQYLCKAQNGVGEGISKLAEVTINGKGQKIKVRCSRVYQ